MAAITIPVDELGAGGHACLTFSDEEERLDIVAAFVADGLAGGQQVLCYTDAGGPARLCDELTGRDIDATGALGRGQLRIHTIDDHWLTGSGFDPDGALRALSDQIAHATRGGYAGLRVTADMSWATRPLPGIEHLGWYESAVNDLFTGVDLASICQYDRQQFDPVTLAVVTDVHSHAIAAATYRDDPLLRICRQYRPRGIRIAGELDYQAIDDLRTALGEAVRLDHDIHVNLTQLRFIDAACAGEILNTATALPDGRRLIVRCTTQIATVVAALSPTSPTQLRMAVTDEHP